MLAHWLNMHVLKHRITGFHMVSQTVESTTQALCDLALRFGEGDEESMEMGILTMQIFFHIS
ncbi:hypothetical protein KFK09_022278 [Dendrobium nobile]|uniref:Uncharacterized protein n=1 Tax=Dendrobium nobile TaxID=94219 RepID=A0A8T3AIX3_DENNO|nr:hypothetical protein KFK09_022278 [Dendrobium nobile]